jgi:hypothetical protein
MSDTNPPAKKHPNPEEWRRGSNPFYITLHTKSFLPENAHLFWSSQEDYRQVSLMTGITTLFNVQESISYTLR